MAYSKVLVARNSPKNKCYANDGEWLIVARKEHCMKGRALPADHHFFIGVNSHEPCRYGWVRGIDYVIQPEDLATKYSPNPTPDLVDSCKLLLDAISAHADGTPFACTYSKAGLLNKVKKLKVHKVFFYILPRPRS